MAQCVLKLGQAVDLDLDLHQVAGGRPGAAHSLGDRAAGRDVVVLDQDRVIEAEAVIDPAAATHRVFLQRAQAGRGLAGIDDPRARAFHGVHIGPGQGGDARQTAHQVQRHALGAQQGASIGVDPGEPGPGADLSAVLGHRLEVGGGVELQDRQTGAGEAADNAGLAAGEHGAQARVRRHAGLRGHIARPAQVLGQGGADRWRDQDIGERLGHSAAYFQEAAAGRSAHWMKVRRGASAAVPSAR